MTVLGVLCTTILNSKRMRSQNAYLGLASDQSCGIIWSITDHLPLSCLRLPTNKFEGKISKVLK